MNAMQSLGNKDLIAALIFFLLSEDRASQLLALKEQN